MLLDGFFMIHTFVLPEGAPCSVNLVTYFTLVARRLYMSSFYVFKNVCFHFWGFITIFTLPVSFWVFHHLWCYQVFQIWNSCALRGLKNYKKLHLKQIPTFLSQKIKTLSLFSFLFMMSANMKTQPILRRCSFPTILTSICNWLVSKVLSLYVAEDSVPAWRNKRTEGTSENLPVLVPQD